MINSLTQVILKLTCPGIPDIYQGNELWDFSLVDPDNRRPVDYPVRAKALEEIEDKEASVLYSNWEDGRIKIYVTQKLLKLRTEHPLLFSEGQYLPVSASGPFAANIVAFMRVHNDERLLVVVPRNSTRVGSSPIGTNWKETLLSLSSSASRWSNIFTGKEISTTETGIDAAKILQELPFCVALNIK
jgi:(1->4)-alpha-D-glucan 1-alpha-D-glucosylmutase